MFPEIVIGPVLIVSGVLIVAYRRQLQSVIHKRAERIYGEATADLWASGGRASVGLLVAGAGWVAMGVITVIDALAV